ncbi:MAG TPA: elongation factor P [Chthoniobacterales bacterium]|nr:elongation factor P [Chthoniobacterales bacterium]
MAAANDLRKGMAIRYNGDIAVVLDVQHRTPGNLRAFVQGTLRSIRTGKSSNVRFSSTETVELVDVTRRTLEYSYKDQDGFVFMDPENYETETLSADLVGSAQEYLSENLRVEVLYAEDRPVEIELPSSVTLKISEAPEGLRGDSATNVQKTAKLETGKSIQVPLFIKEGELIRVDTRTGAYLGRA